MLFGIFAFSAERRMKTHAETDFGYDFQSADRVSDRPVCKHRTEGVMTMQKDVKEKLAGILLTTLAALVCSAIDYFLNQEE